MNRKRIILTGLFLFMVIKLFGQRVEFTYDENGNQISRTIIVEQLKSNSVKFPIVNPKSLKSLEYSIATGSDQSTQQSISSSNKRIKSGDDISKKNMKSGSESDGIETIVYPNPNKGLLKIDILNLPLESRTEMRLYDLSGSELLSKRNFESHTEIDISRFKEGIYILRIQINDKKSDFKIIKGQTTEN